MRGVGSFEAYWRVMGGVTSVEAKLGAAEMAVVRHFK